MSMTNSYSDKHPEKGIDTYAFLEKTEECLLALERYQCLKRVQQCDLTPDDKLFIENFEVAMRFW